MLRNRPAMRLMAGYTSRFWELLGMWAWTPAFIAAGIAMSGLASGGSVEIVSSTMGRLSDRTERRSVLFSMALTSTLCSFVLGWLIGWALARIFAVVAIYGSNDVGLGVRHAGPRRRRGDVECLGSRP